MKRKEEKKAKGKRQRAESKGQRAESQEQRAESQEQGARKQEQRVSSEHPFLPIEKGEYGFSQEGVNGEQPRPMESFPPEQTCRAGRRGSSGRAVANSPVRPTARLSHPGGQQPVAIERITTVFKIEKPSGTGTMFPAEGCFSGSRTVSACLLIRVFNN
jgi:hypothetical protein